jgi:hypothetical protein
MAEGITNRLIAQVYRSLKSSGCISPAALTPIKSAIIILQVPSTAQAHQTHPAAAKCGKETIRHTAYREVKNMVPILWGQPIHLWLGMILLLCVIFQVLVAKQILKVPFKWHRIMGYVILLLALIHGSIAMALSFGILTR